MSPNQETILGALRTISASIPRNDWVKIAFSIKANNCNFSIFHEWSKNASNYKSKKDCLTAWNNDNGGAINSGYLFKIAMNNGWINTGDNDSQNKQPFFDNLADWFNSLEHYTSHPYAIKQQIHDKLNSYKNILRQGKDKQDAFIADPIHNVATGKLCGFNRIYKTGGDGKRLAPKTVKKGNAGLVGKVSGTERVFITEGMADAIHIHHKESAPVFIASDVGNIEHVALAVRKKYPSNPITIIADSDYIGFKTALKTANTVNNTKIKLSPFHKDITKMVINHADDLVNIPVNEGTEGAITVINSAIINAVNNFDKDLINDEITAKWFQTAVKFGMQNKTIALQKFTTAIQQKTGMTKAEAKRNIKAEAQQLKFEELKKRGTDNALMTYDGNGNPVLVPHSKASEILANISNIILNLRFDDISDKWMGYLSNNWEMSTDARVDKFIVDSIKQQAGGLGFNDSYMKGVKNMIKSEIISSEWDRNKNLISLKNGVFNLDTNGLLSHDKKYRITSQLPFDYDPQADCPTTKQFLLDSVGSDEGQQQILRAYMNCIIKGRADLQRCLVIVGMGGTGKGTFMRLCANLIGNKNLHTTNFKHLEGSTGRFEVGKLYHKKLLVVPDADQYTGSVETFKSVTGQDPLRYEEKNKNNTHNGNFIFEGMAIIASNEPLAVNDHTSGWKRRTLNLTFDNAFNKRDGKLGEKLGAELSGIFNWVLAMPDDEVTDYIKNTNDKVGSARELAFEALILGNPLASWVHDNVILQADNIVQVGSKKEIMTELENGDKVREYQFQNERLYPNYLMWCDSVGRKPQAMQKFSGLLSGLFKSPDLLNIPSISKNRTGKHGTHFVGLAIRPHTDITTPSPIDLSSIKNNQKEKGEEDLSRGFI